MQGHETETEKLDESPTPVVPEGDGDFRGCGYLSFKPPCFQRFARPVVFLCVASVFFFADGFIVGAIQGTVTTIEHRYQFTFRQMGAIQSCFSLGGIIGVFVLVLVGSKPGSHRPRTLGILSLVVALCAVIQTLPQFFQVPYVPSGYQQVSNGTGDSVFQEVGVLCSTQSQDVCVEKDDGNYSVSANKVTFYIIICSAVLQGISLLIMYPNVYSFISDCTSPADTAFYSGLLGGINGISPVVGILVTAAILGVWVDFYRNDLDLAITPDDSSWIGAWWLVFIISAALYLLPAVFFLGFPRDLRPYRKRGPVNFELLNGNKEVVRDDSDVATLRHEGFKESVLRLWTVLRNRDCFLTCLTQASSNLLVYGYALYVPKYLEVQFDFTRQMADLITGCLLAPAYAIGSLLAGYLVKRLNISYRGLVSLSCVTLLIAAICVLIVMFIGCPNSNIAGVFSPYQGESEIELDSACNSDCRCSLSVYAPVCDGNGTTYFSACHAGCKVKDDYGYSNCSCLPWKPLANVSSDGANMDGLLATAEDGACDGVSCNSAAAVYLALLTAVLLFGRFAYLLGLNVIMRSVTTSEERTVALGIDYLLSLIATSVAGFLFGSSIDSACQVWQQSPCDGEIGACLLYDSDRYRYAFNALALGVTVIALLVMLVVWKFPSHKDGEEEEDVGDTLRQ